MSTKKKAVSYNECSAAEALHFEAVTKGYIAHPPAKDDTTIGTLSEKRLHAIIKKYLCDDESFHEIVISSVGDKKRKITADILRDGDIIEVQTGGFFPLKQKLKYYLENTDYDILLVHPMAAVKYISWIDPTDGGVSKKHASPKRGKVTDIAKELYWISDILTNEKYRDRFTLDLMFLEIEEYRMLDGWSRDKKKGSNRYDRIPTKLCGNAILSSAEDYEKYFLLPFEEKLPREFTAAEYTKASGIRGRAAYGVLHLLEGMGITEQCEKKGRAQVWKKR